MRVSSCNWLGGEVVAGEVNAAGFEKAGYTNITTSDSVVHGQVKQAGKFSFARIYESGHMVPFYQPLLALEIFTRAINGLDIATGTVKVAAEYLTKGTAKSEYREGNRTMQFEVLPKNATYNFKTGAPDPFTGGVMNVDMGRSKNQKVLNRRKAMGIGMKGRKVKP